MKLAVMQPYFLPYLGYFSLIKATDQWIVFDIVQYIYQGWINRNRILKVNKSWQYIIVPTAKHSHKTLIKDIIIKNEMDWSDKILRQLNHYKKSAPYYSDTIDILKSAFAEGPKFLSELNLLLLEKVCNYLNIGFQYQVASKMNIEFPEINDPAEWGILFCKILGAKTFVNSMGGENFISRKKYSESGIELKFLKSELPVYSQRRSAFERGLSIVDVMMFNSPDEINSMLDKYSLK